ncbi:hypothetical protein BRAS3843_2770110 [Bradyrhizobium sp. STM 3843]|nr:hypothetical protein BRAS3843_2770110 [Bradyrhizobium sp. STM 3843]
MTGRDGFPVNHAHVSGYHMGNPVLRV